MLYTERNVNFILRPARIWKKFIQSNVKDNKTKVLYFTLKCVILYSMCDSALSFCREEILLPIDAVSGVKFATKCIEVNN